MAFRGVAQTGLRAGPGEKIVLTQHHWKDRSRNDIPVGIELDRHDWLYVHKPLGALSLLTEVPIVVSEERHADEGGEWVGEFFCQSFAVICRKRCRRSQEARCKRDTSS